MDGVRCVYERALPNRLPLRPMGVNKESSSPPGVAPVRERTGVLGVFGIAAGRGGGEDDLVIMKGKVMSGAANRGRSLLMIGPRDTDTGPDDDVEVAG